MYKIPEEYSHNRILNKSNFMTKEETTRNKKIIRESLTKVRLDSQIEGEDIPSCITEKYNVSAIMILHIHLKDIKYAEFLNRIYQKAFKVFLIIKFIDQQGNIKIGLGYKRLSELNKNEIVLEDCFVTEKFTEDFLDQDFNNYEKYFNYTTVINRQDKLSFYIEAMLKVYILNNINNIKSYKNIIDSKIWYSQDKTLQMYHILKKKVDIKYKYSKANLTKEKIEYNKQLMELRARIQGIIN